MTPAGAKIVPGSRGRAVIATNSVWTLYAFRISLMLALQARGFEVIAAGPEDRHVGAFADHGIRFAHVPISVSGRNPLRELAIVAAFYRLYRRERPVLVHHFSAKAVLFGSLGARLARVPRVMNTITGLGYAFQGQHRVLLWGLARLARLALRPPCRVSFQNSEDLNFFLARDLIHTGQGSVIPGSGIDTDRFAPRASDPVRRAGPLTFLMYGRMIPQKGVWEYCRAAEQLIGRFGATRVRFVLIGGADSDNSTGVEAEWIANPWTIPGVDLEREAARGFVTWLPHQADILPHVHEADVVVAPSYYPEGLPRGLLESMACGKAIITTDTPGCRDTVEEGVNGLLVRPRDTEDLARAMATLVERPDLAEAMGKGSRRRAIEEFSDARVIERTFGEYARLGLHV